MSSKNLCIYHGNCMDGFGAAWVVHNYFGRNEKLCDFHPGVYGETPPDVTGKNITVVDFSYPREVMKNIITKANSVVVLDHHKTAIDDLKGIQFTDSLFDVNRSGAMIAWNYFFPNQEPPKLIKYIQDRDLWKFILDHSKAVNEYIAALPYSFFNYYQLHAEIEDDKFIDTVIDRGYTLLRKKMKEVEELATHARMTNIGGFMVPTCNAPYFVVSELGAYLCNYYPDAPFSACYWETPEGRVYGLRSVKGSGMDVSEVAKNLGGGGHKHAAGFKVSYEELHRKG